MRHLTGIAALLLGLGLLLAEALPVPTAAAAASCAAACGILALAVRRRRGVVLAACAVALTLGLWLRASEADPPRALVLCGEAGRFRAVVDGPIERDFEDVGREPEVGSRGGGARAPPPAARQKTVLALTAERCGERWVARSLRVRATLRGGPRVRRGDELELVLRVSSIEAPRNPTDLDPRVFARRDGLTARAQVSSVHVVVRRGGGVLAALDDLRAGAAAELEARLPVERAALAKALVMGDRAALSDETRDRWADAGLAHLLAVSGMHVTLVCLVAFAVLRWLCRLVPGAAERFTVQVVSAWLTLPFVVAFCAWSASPASAVRATVMGVIALLGTSLGRPSLAMSALGTTCFVMLAVTPACLHDPGFSLSVLAVGALLALPRPAADEGVLARARRLVTTALLTSVAASAATAPVLAHYFGRVSLVAPLTNLVAVPLGSTLATPLALVCVAVAPWWPAAGDALASVLGALFAALDVVIDVGLAAPLAVVDVPRPRWPEHVAFAGLVAALGRWLVVRAAPSSAERRGLVALRVAAGCAVALSACVAARVLAARLERDLVVRFPYVGQGDAAVLSLPGGATVLIDAGGRTHAGALDPGRAVLVPLLRQLGARRVELAILSHAHPDHLGGFAAVARHVPIEELWWNGQGAGVPAMRELVALVAAHGGTVRGTHELPVRSERHGVGFEILHPRAPGAGHFEELGMNDNSLVVRVTHGARAFVFSGDVEEHGEAALVELARRAGPTTARADVLKIPHHGSRTSSSAALLEVVSPGLAVISCGDRNRFGFPHRPVLERLQRRGVVILRTDEDGMVTVTSDGEGLVAHGHRAGRPPLVLTRGAPRLEH